MSSLKKIPSLAIVGASGLVGKTVVQELNRSSVRASKVSLYSHRKKGSLTLWDQEIEFTPLQENTSLEEYSVVLFATEDAVSRQWIPKLKKPWVVDHSQVFRMDSSVPLVIPQVNKEQISSLLQPQVIANPNCCTIQLCSVLSCFKEHLENVFVSTYQSVSGSGQQAQEELAQQTQGSETFEVYPQKIFNNHLPQIGNFETEQYSEEIKIQEETRKILSLPQLPISAWCVRCPTMNGHSEAVWMTLDQKMNREDILSLLSQNPELKIKEEKKNYFTIEEVNGNSWVGVGRIHQDPTSPYIWKLWIVGDNLIKGAAYNSVQIIKEIQSLFF